MRQHASSSTPTIAHIDHVLLLVDDLWKAVAFYELLGFTLESRLSRYAMVELRAGSTHLDLVDVSREEGAWARPEVAGGRNVDHVAVAIEAPDGERLRAYLAERSIPIAEERRESGSLSLYVRDPSGNTIELLARA